ncbi:LuxR C-terminal-related transcriptional regulator [Nocardia sp. NPDC056100]|uniref:helix-turn-helix transcriptional regulator n=1 Tax=Nocardia sp. NPDC056100 TaxID=3345712 RepID=UPI0035E03A44
MIRSELDTRFLPAHPGKGAHIVILRGPAGSGKTVLLQDWIERRTRSDTAVAWVTVTPALDRDPTRWPETTAALTARDTPALLVIDDAHLLSHPDLLAALEHLIRHAPPTMTVVISGRCDPPLRWHTLNTHDRLSSIDAEDLRLTGTQVAQLFRQHGCELEPAVLDRVLELTRGWAALTRIAAIALASAGQDQHAALAELARPAQPVADFLIRETLSGLEPLELEFLMRTSTPARFTEELADALYGARTHELLDALTRAGVPITRASAAGELWFEYPPLLRAHLKAEVHRRNASEVSELRGIERDYRRRFLRERGVALVLDGRGSELFGEFAAPGSAFADDPFIWRLRAVDALTRGADSAELTYLDFRGAQPHSESDCVPATWLAALDFAIAADTAVTTGSGVTELDPLDAFAATGNSDIDCYVYVQYGTAMLLRGRFEQAAALLKSAITISEHFARPRLTLRAMARLAVTVGYRGSLTAMWTIAEQAVEFARRNDILDSPDARRALTAAGMAHAVQGDVWDQRIVGDLAAAAGAPVPPGLPVDALPTEIDWRLLVCVATTGEHAAVRALRSGLADLLRRGPQPAIGAALLLVATVGQLIRLREIHSAEELVATARPALGQTAEFIVAQAVITTAAHKSRSTRAMLEPLLRQSDSMHPLTAVTGWLLYAEAQHRLRVPAKTVAALEAALRISAPERLIRPWLNRPLAVELLDIHLGQFGRGDTFAEVVRQHPATVRQYPAPNLTEAEWLVLKHLPSGRTGNQIAADLGVSINTVKTHLRGVYLKLGANSRGQAVTRARTIGLL